MTDVKLWLLYETILLNAKNNSSSFKNVKYKISLQFKM